MVARAAHIGLISPQEVPSPPPPSLSAITTATDVASSALEVEETQKYIRALCESLTPFFGRFLVTMGERGVLSATPTSVESSMSSSRLHFTLHPSPGASSSSSSSTGVKGSKVNVVSTTGAGDTFAGAVLAGLCLCLSRSSSTTGRDTSSSASGGDRDPATLSVEALSELIQLGQRAAILTLQSQEAVAEDLGGALLGLGLQGDARSEG
ncbi:hypothetical protein BCV69DRAFT_61222 [Microstroma glucosiphilum]|uniref:Carbohydrate kinase PfkB domain-containing protein n=1 Tax=Pseudomicrostroma glucosiphilum TaxID=1684307 RepID=A0A316U1K2_9BASI|nr:hypothetical protein BCV69DRAFT_61222 [Pseudomicrostroma glucosiphilum]PWN18728.1 hypothetical protein BCV69DRAFT_61222 [Pseudomicrostroma glucosiphilum]